MLTVTGCDFIFDPGEIKEFPENSPYLRWLRECPDLEEIKDENVETPKEVVGETSKEEEEVFYCDVCGWVGKNERAVRMHKMKKHGK